MWYASQEEQGHKVITNNQIRLIGWNVEQNCIKFNVREMEEINYKRYRGKYSTYIWVCV